MKRNAKQVGRFLIRVVESVYVKEEVQNKLAGLCEMFEEASMEMEIGMDEGEYPRNGRIEEDSDWCEEMWDVLEEHVAKNCNKKEEEKVQG